jgi:hypothetical protein
MGSGVVRKACAYTQEAEEGAVGGSGPEMSKLGFFCFPLCFARLMRWVYVAMYIFAYIQSQNFVYFVWTAGSVPTKRARLCQELDGGHAKHITHKTERNM